MGMVGDFGLVSLKKEKFSNVCDSLVVIFGIRTYDLFLFWHCSGWIGLTGDFCHVGLKKDKIGYNVRWSGCDFCNELFVICEMVWL